MKNWSHRKRCLVGTAASLAILALVFFAGVFAIGYFNLFHAHEHCIRATEGALLRYASTHDGRFPFHTNGFGDAVLLLLRETGDDPRIFTAPGDDGKSLKAYLLSGADVSEKHCTRTYVQGLCETNNPGIALVFDRYPTPGGDHTRCPWGSPIREVLMLGGVGLRFIHEKDWPGFREEQIKLLIAEGVPRDQAESYYQPPER